MIENHTESSTSLGFLDRDLNYKPSIQANIDTGEAVPICTSSYYYYDDIFI